MAGQAYGSSYLDEFVVGSTHFQSVKEEIKNSGLKAQPL